MGVRVGVGADGGGDGEPEPSISMPLCEEAGTGGRALPLREAMEEGAAGLMVVTLSLVPVSSEDQKVQCVQNVKNETSQRERKEMVETEDMNLLRRRRGSQRSAEGFRRRRKAGPRCAREAPTGWPRGRNRCARGCPLRRGARHLEEEAWPVCNWAAAVVAVAAAMALCAIQQLQLGIPRLESMKKCH